MSQETCKTVKVESPVTEANPTGYIVINESDVTPEHKLFVEKAEKTEVPAKK